MKDNVSKHINILHHLSRIIDQYHLLQVSEIEQQLAAVQDHKAAHKQVVSTPVLEIEQQAAHKKAYELVSQCMCVNTHTDTHRHMFFTSLSLFLHTYTQVISALEDDHIRPLDKLRLVTLTLLQTSYILYVLYYT
jgi:hypothetical protein